MTIFEATKKSLNALTPQSAQKNIILHQLMTEAVVLSKLKSIKFGLQGYRLTGRIRVHHEKKRRAMSNNPKNHEPQENQGEILVYRNEDG